MQAFTMAIRGDNTWVLEARDDFDEVRRIQVSLSDYNAERLSESLRGGGRNQEECRIAAAVVQMANARTRAQGEDFEISDQEVDEFLAKTIKV